MPITLNIEESIYNSVITILTAAMVTTPTLGVLSYVKTLRQGNIDESISAQKPYIVVMPTDIPEKWKASQYKKEMNMAIEIRAVMDVPAASPLVTTAAGKGMLKIDGDIKNVIEADLTLAGLVNSIEISTKKIANLNGGTWETVILLITQKEFTKGGR